MNADPKPNALAPVQVTRVFLDEVRFNRLGGGLPVDEDSFSGSFELLTGDPGRDEFGVRLTYSMEEPSCEFSVSYGAIFRLVEELGPDESLEQVWRTVAARLAPVTLYPFIRETATSLCAKAGLPPLMPPVVDFGNLIDPAEISFEKQEELDLDDEDDMPGRE